MSKQRKAPGNNFILAGLAVMIVLIPVKTLAFFENIDVNDFFSWGDEAIVITNKVEATANTGGNTAKEGKINTGSAKASVVVETKTDDDITEVDVVVTVEGEATSTKQEIRAGNVTVQAEAGSTASVDVYVKEVSSNREEQFFDGALPLPLTGEDEAADTSEEDIGTSEKSNELPKEAPAGIDKKKGFIGHIIVSLTSFIQHVFSFFTFT
ncbi:MAG: hypothetical protein A3C80_00215 [Candidatus Ryanbacteria bacterium RIFCSPHIGHO2_02_FULL_45_43]|uniref:Uncharacterized protein n=1 Tax=Candidatus Ryanbacteria bacterium RIFCSPHIGHO2_01_45_13 TaxID=1802112 RepID=A0A1G2G0A3_9BACT|nr:MAG: hypothetical protein A2718_01600 [Candidatus Ryanbacteria bacterium RIFCSPHIGHO2_01_FULL_44_130]OGZ43763.1 MAG: hypothetical protein A2W41_04720 [Candidatus Ryanbacteria bacterium RIFCSPHIGHO2_01_45_13]OGZ47705.1 MAG: hypothetical protein A3C80_00215 [Candidatus Ryanbacteria bacterium RIFCSPHIGHO2_02_FULL_45_43]OGZ49601.1 MAG: hypothetical protein A3E55_04215 [Candidatus Ryanbacteria bacterium RIFCSPHIGHO2_12_FULL_44_20]OGZ51283.1 MAG: hypothetical protein A3A17_04540 [Candidatus Ryanba